MTATREIDADDFAITAFWIDGTSGRTGLHNVPIDNFIVMDEEGMPDKHIFQNGRDTFQNQLRRQLHLHIEEQQADLLSSLIAQFGSKCYRFDTIPKKGCLLYTSDAADE